MPWTWDNVKKQAVRVRDEVVGLNELARALSQSIAAEPLAGLAGIYGTATGGVGEGVRLIDKVREKVGYQPQTKEGIRNLDALARALSPVNNALEKARTTLGDGAFNATGSPALAAAAYTAPDAILSALGARPAMAAGRSAQAGIGRAVRRATELPSPTMGSPASQIGAIRAYHGSPHDFDRFSMDHIGTGEGAQAYGHGMYFAQKESVADDYRRNLSKGPVTYRYDGADVLSGDTRSPRGLDVSDPKAAAVFYAASDGVKGARAYFKKQGAWGQRAIEELDKLAPEKVEVVGNQGRLYEVELAPDETDLLDWDAPLSEQPEKVRNALAGIARDYEALGDNRFIGLNPDRLQYDPLMYPEQFVKQSGQRGAIESELRSAGIPGIRYLDGGSRAAGDGSRNYVMFDDSLIKILGKK